MKRIVEIITCDICGKEAEATTQQGRMYRKVNVPQKIYDDDGTWNKGNAMVDMCAGCNNAFFTLFYHHFAGIATKRGNRSILKKFKTEDPFTTEEPEEFNNAPNT